MVKGLGRISKIIGSLFLVAMISSLAGGGIIEMFFTGPSYFKSIPANTFIIFSGVFLELINALCVVGIAVLMFQIFYRINKNSAAAYLGFRIFESILCLAAAFIPLLLAISGMNYLKAGNPVSIETELLSNSFFRIRSTLTGIYFPLFFSFGAFIFYYMLYRSRLIPRFISLWGFTGAALILILNLSDAGETVKMFLALPIILNEIFLGFWLIIKGFEPAAMDHIFDTGNPREKNN